MMKEPFWKIDWIRLIRLRTIKKHDWKQLNWLISIVFLDRSQSDQSNPIVPNRLFLEGKTCWEKASPCRNNRLGTIGLDWPDWERLRNTIEINQFNCFQSCFFIIFNLINQIQLFVRTKGTAEITQSEGNVSKSNVILSCLYTYWWMRHYFLNVRIF